MDKARWQQIEDLYNAAMERPPDERTIFLGEKCAGDTELFDEVRSLLNSATSGESFLAEPDFELGLKVLAEERRVLAEGQDFGSYRILGFLGRGGMGEVYLAEDTRLGRQVALKVLPTELASDRDRVRRFIQEARAASALNHPNILTIHEIGEADGRRFIASESVKGVTLRECLKGKAPLRPADTVDIALQVAAALNTAHCAGIVHRDIKPENVMVREDGLVKVLDFGLAKLTELPESTNAAEILTTTGPGLVMGTVAYMSPEQARGQRTDARSDIWSFGVVLYEMLAGRLPFSGETTSDVIAAILMTEPTWPAEDPAERAETLWQIAAKALRKDPASRYQSAKEMADDLRSARLDANGSSAPTFAPVTGFNPVGDTGSNIMSTAEVVSPAPSGEARKSTGRAVFAFTAVLSIVLAGGYAAFSLLKRSSWFWREPMKVARLFDAGKTVSAAISPDGKYIVHAVADAGKQSLWMRHIASNSNVQLVPPEKASFFGMAFSPDGNFIYYIKGTGSDELFRIPVLGGDSRKILDGVNSPISLSPDGRRFSFIREMSGDENALIVANVDGSGEVELARRKHPEEFRGSAAAWSPDGAMIAAPVFGRTEKPFVSIDLFPLNGGAEGSITPQKWREIGQVVWLPDGSGLVGAADAEDEALAQIWFFPASGEEASRVTNDLNQYDGISLAADGSRLLTIQWQNRYNMWLMPDGRAEEARILSNNINAQFQFITLAPDGRIVFPSNENAGENRDIWIINPDGSNAKQLTSNAGGNILPCATADGRYIVFASNRGDGKIYHVWRMNIDGTAPVQLTNGAGERGPRCSPDGRTIVYASGGPDEGMDKSRLWRMTIDGAEQTRLTDYPSSWQDISPDGKFVALRYKDNETAPLKLGIIDITDGHRVKSFDVKVNSRLRWKPDGKSITFVRNEEGVSNVWEQPVSGEPPRQVTKFTAESIVGFDWSANNELICVRGYEARDPVMISNFK